MEKQFAKFVTTHQRRLVGAATRLLRNQAEAEEVVQEAFIGLWRHYQQLPATARLPWILRVTRNACLDLLRHRKLQTRYAVVNAPAHHLSPLPEPDHQAQCDALGGFLQRAVEALPEPQRSLIILREMEGYAYADLAAALDLSPEQVKVYLYRGRRKLRIELNSMESHG